MTGHLITNARILDGTGRAPVAGAVRVEGSRIVEVAAATTLAPRCA
jgi:N-acyl-D-aspartate/D-glutamate deacylase